jgi:hypothetical protein
VFSRHLFLSCNKARWTHLMTIKCRGKTSLLCTKHPHFNINDAAMYCLGTGVRASGEFAHTYCICQNCKIIGKVKMETTGMWGLTLIILKDIKCFQIWVYFEGIGINFNFENFQNKIFPLFILRTIQSMHARYHRTLQHLWKIEGWFVYTSFSLNC